MCHYFGRTLCYEIIYNITFVNVDNRVWSVTCGHPSVNLAERFENIDKTTFRKILNWISNWISDMGEHLDRK